MDKNKNKKTDEATPLQPAKAFSADDIYAVIEPYLDVLEYEDDDSVIDFFLNFGPSDVVHFYTAPEDDGITVCFDTEGEASRYAEDLKELEQLLRTRGRSMREWKTLRSRLDLSN